MAAEDVPHPDFPLDMALAHWEDKVCLMVLLQHICPGSAKTNAVDCESSDVLFTLHQIILSAGVPSSTIMVVHAHAFPYRSWRPIYKMHVGLTISLTMLLQWERSNDRF